jgi:Zn-dependent alcohol dehydrogenase
MEPVIHPFVAGASVAVILLSGVGIAAVTGYLPGSNAQKAERAVVVEVKEIDVKGQGTGLGAAGAVSGAAVGRQIERSARSHKRYDVSVRLQDGSVKTVSSDAPPAWKSGDKVRVVNGRLEPV